MKTRLCFHPLREQCHKIADEFAPYLLCHYFSLLVFPLFLKSSNNLANVNTSGYKADKLAFKDTMQHFAHDFIREPLENLRSKPLFPESRLRSRVRLAVAETDFSQGSMNYTGNSLDFAISGEGFFRIQTPNGAFLSRNGSFCQNADGMLMTKQGWPVLGEGGPITVPEGTRNIHVNSEGAVFADGRR